GGGDLRQDRGHRCASGRARAGARAGRPGQGLAARRVAGRAAARAGPGRRQRRRPLRLTAQMPVARSFCGPRSAADNGRGHPHPRWWDAGWVGLEVLGEDEVVIERADEAIDLLFHVRVHQALEIADERLGAAIELLVEALDKLLLEDA